MEIPEVIHGAVQGPTGIVNGWTITCTFTDAEMDDLLASYDPSSATSPSVTVCRPIVREMLDAVIANTQDGA